MNNVATYNRLAHNGSVSEGGVGKQREGSWLVQSSLKDDDEDYNGDGIMDSINRREV